MFQLFGKKKPQFKVEPKQEIELEFVSPDLTTIENFFTKVLQVDRKKFTVQVPLKDRQPISAGTGESVTVTYLNGDAVFSFETKIVDRRDRELDLALPKEITEEKTPDSQSDYMLEIPIPVEYRAMNLPHLQTAITKAITNSGIQIITNLPLPIGTTLNVELEIPNSPAIKTKGKVLRSQRLPTDNRKNLTELEFEDILPNDKAKMLRYAIFFQQRQLRKAKLIPPQ